MACETPLTAPFLRRGLLTRNMMRAVLASLLLIALHVAWRYDAAFAVRFAAALAIAAAVEGLYALLADGRPECPRASTLVTAGLLTLSVPARMPLTQLAAGLLVAVLFGKRMPGPKALRLNPMLLGRLFLMLVFPDPIQQWNLGPVPEDAISTATPLGLYAAESAAVSPLRIWTGAIGGVWEGIYAIQPGAPGEIMPLLALLCGIFLYGIGALDWRPAAGYLAGFAAACALLGLPVVFHLAAGSTWFTAAFVITDPRTTPASRSGRLAAGLLAGGANALVRLHGYYPEGVVPAILAVNLLAPTLDRIAFHARGLQLRRAVHPQPQTGETPP